MMSAIMCWICIVGGLVVAVATQISIKPRTKTIIKMICYTVALGLVTNGVWHLLSMISSPESSPPTSTIQETLPMATIPDITEAPLPLKGMSNAGTMLRDVQYNSSGKIVSASEEIGDTWINWKYIYDDAGCFQYRIRNIGNARSSLTSKSMSGKDTTYSELDETIENCVGFTLSYSVSKVLKGNYQGEREVYVSKDKNTWELVNTFDYNSMDTVTVPFTFKTPISFVAFATPRTHPDDSSFHVNQSILDIWVADYRYVEIT